MTNVTAGTVEFVGSGLLAHSTSSDEYTVVSSADGIARKGPFQYDGWARLRTGNDAVGIKPLLSSFLTMLLITQS